MSTEPTTQAVDAAAPPAAPNAITTRKKPLLDRIPVISHLRQSVGLQRFMLTLGVALTVVFLVIAALAQWIAPYGFAQRGVDGKAFGSTQPPNPINIWGTTVGFDVYSRVIWGAQTAFLAIAAALLFSFFIGIALGLFSGYFGGWLDRILVVIADAIYALPSLLLAIVLSIAISGGRSTLSSGVLATALAITVVFVPQYFRVIRSEVVRIKAEPFVESARVIGVPTFRILTRHVLRNSMRSIPVIVTLNASEALLTLAGLGFLGFGIEATAAGEWGYDLNRSVADVSSGVWWTAIPPGLAIVLVVLGITLVGESLNDLSDPRQASPPPGRRCRMTDTTLGDVASIRDLTVMFATDGEPVRAIDGVSLEARPGEVLAIVGKSGSGKTVTAHTLLGLLPETATLSGAVIVRGRDGAETDIVHASHDDLQSMRGRDAAMVFQEASTALNPVFTIGFQIAEGLQAHEKLSNAEAKKRAVEILRKVGIPDPETRVDDYPHQFSGGQKQRVVIAMALVLNARLIIADEPTTALDVTVQAEILELLRACRDEFGATIVLITHNMGVVADLADRVIVMYRGEIVEQAPVHELFANPKEEYTRELLAAVPHVGRGKSATQDPHAAAPTTPPEGSLVVAKAVQIGYPGRFGAAGVVAVKGVDFWIGPGEVLGLVGESGSGKTTIGRAMVGLTEVLDGSLSVLGLEMKGVKNRQLTKIRPDVGFVFQDPATSFNPLLTVAECIAEPLVVHKKHTSARATRARVDELLDAVHLPTSFGDRYPHELSGGQRQRASLARALALNPKLLIADEPTSALDVSVQARVLELFAELQREFGFASLFISHDLAVVDEVADRIVVLRHGEIREQGTTVQVLTDPKDEYTKRLLASLPVPDPVEQAARRVMWQATRDVSA